TLWDKPELSKVGTITIDNNKNRDYGKKIIYIYELITTIDNISRIPCNTEPENLGPWKQFSFLEILNLPVIDSVKYYICEKIEKEYFYVLCKHVLFNGLKEAIYIFDRNQTSTYIFSKFSNIPKEEIKQIKKNREYFDELIKKGTCVFINSSRERVLMNKQMR